MRDPNVTAVRGMREIPIAVNRCNASSNCLGHFRVQGLGRADFQFGVFPKDPSTYIV